MRCRTSAVGLAAAIAILPAAGAHAQDGGADAAFVHVATTYRVVPNITYLTANNWDAKLDVYQARAASSPRPTLIYVHGGNWVGGTKEGSSLFFLPFLQMNWNVVNIDYRVARISQAPAAVEDCFCALRWVYQHAKDYNVDVSRIVVSGNSAGGHLALMMGMAPESAGFDRRCPGPEDLKVAAVINWYGFPDVSDLVEGENMRPAVVTWLGDAPDRDALAARVSPITYVRPGLPPIMTIQGDADPTSPYVHSVRLRDALTKAGVRNELVTVPGGKHGGFSEDEMVRIYRSIRAFLNPIVAGR